MKTFHSWLGRIGGLIVLELVRLWGPPWAIITIQIPCRLQFFPVIQTYVESTYQQQDTLVHTHTFTQRDIHSFPLSLLHPLFLPAQFFKSLTCILLSFTLPPPLPVFPRSPPLSPCGFCHLFTDEWPLHRHDLNVSHPSHYASLPLFLSPSSCVSLPVRLDISQTSFFFSPLTPTLRSEKVFDQFWNCWPWLLFLPPLPSPSSLL